MVNGYKFRDVPLLVMLVVALIPSGGVMVFIGKNRISDAAVFIALTIVCIFAFVTVCTMGLIVLNAASVIELDKDFMRWLGGATVGEVAGMLLIVVRYYFRATAK